MSNKFNLKDWFLKNAKCACGNCITEETFEKINKRFKKWQKTKEYKLLEKEKL